MKRAFTVYYNETGKFLSRPGEKRPFPKAYPLATIKIEWVPDFENIFLKEDVLSDVLEELQIEYGKVFDKILKYQEKSNRRRKRGKVKK